MKRTIPPWFARIGRRNRGFLAVVLLPLIPVLAAEPTGRREALPNLDRRLEASRAQRPVGDAVAHQRRADAEHLLRTRLPSLQLERHEIVGAPKWLSAGDGFLTGPAGRGRGMAEMGPAGFAPDDPHRIVKMFVREHAGVFGYDHTALERAALKRDYVTAHNGLRTVSWEQRLEGIPVFNGSFKAHLTRNGELVSVSSGFVPALEKSADAAHRRLVANGATPPISGSQALLVAAANLQFPLDAADVQAVQAPVGAEQRQSFTAPGWRSPAEMTLVWLPISESSVRLCWDVWVVSPRDHKGYELLVDAVTGAVWKRRCMSADASPATYRVFTSESPTPLWPGYSTPSSVQPPVVSRVLQTITSLDATASPAGWITDGTNQLSGNNARAVYWDPISDGSASTHIVQGSPARVFDFPLDITRNPTNYPLAATANAFYWVNWMHDKMYGLGFTEGAANCQLDNFGRGGQGNDRIAVYVQDGSSEDNAGMLTRPEGNSPELSLGLFTGPDPDRDSALDTMTIFHEYTHAVSQRFHELNLDDAQSRGMGEGWSDFFAMSLFSTAADSPNATYPYGAYVTLQLWGTAFDENYYFGIRRYPYSTDLTKNPLTFKDIDPAQASPHSGIPTSSPLFGFPGSEVHMQGEVWCSMLWEARALLIAKYGYTTGNQTMMQLVIDGMRNDPPNPNFIQARNSILTADTVNNGGANHKELWAAFAKRGLGIGATSPVGDTTAGVAESFDSLDNLLVTPSTGLTISGPLGGPFSPTTRVFTLTNQGNTSLPWGARAAPPMQISPASGTLLAGAKQTVTVQLNASAAASLPAGAYAAVVQITNQTSGVVVGRTFTLLAGLQNPPAEAFSSVGGGVNDLAFTELRFTPDATGTTYEFCQSPGRIGFGTDPTPGETLNFDETNFVVKAFSGGAQFPFFGQNYTSVAVGDNGSLVFANAHTNESANYFGLIGHFAAPCISGLRSFYNLDGARISWRQLADRVVATWEDVRDGYTSPPYKTNTFQLELFFDGEIHLTILRATGVGGVTGLSPGGGTPLFFVEANFSVAPSCVGARLALSLPSPVTEGSLTATGRVSIPSPQASPVTVNLSSSDIGEILTPPPVVIAAGRTSATFILTVQDDALLDGTRVAYITATATGYKSDVEPIWVNDNETATLNINSAGTLVEGNGPTTRSVSINQAVDDIIAVQLISSNPDELVVTPSVVLIPPGQTSAAFSVQAVDDNRIDGPQTTSLTAFVANWTPGVRTFTTIDNESTNLVLGTAFFVNESMGTITNGGFVQLSGTLPTNLLVAVISDDESEVRTPFFGVFIPAGETNVPFPLFIQDDALVDGAIITRIRALAGGFGPATNYVWVGDNDGAPEPFNPYPPDLSSNISVDADLSWGRVEGEMLVNGNFEAGDLTGWVTEGDNTGSWVISDGTFDPASPDGPLPPLAGNFGALLQQLGSGRHTISQDVAIPANATGVTLSWSDQIHNHAAQFAANQRFVAELRDATNKVLATLFTTTTNSPAFSDWTNRTFNLAAYRGQTVRLAFVGEDRLGYLNVHLDNVSLIATGATTQTVFDLYFGTNATPTAADFLASTTNPSRILPMLAGGTDYYWQIKARRGTSTNAGPIWTFRTEGQSVAGSAIAFGSSWRYRNTGQNLGTTWTNLNYNDSVWASGLGTLGFGGGQDTTIGFATNQYVTYYFRRKFNVLDPSRVANLTVRLQRDDGAIVWLNGRAAIVENMAARGPWAFDDSALADVTGFSEFIPVTFELPPSLLVAGTNIVAVEMHQFVPRTGFSDDLYFDLELDLVTNIGNEAPAVTLFDPPDFAQVPPTNFTLRATVDDEVTIGTTVEFFADGVSLGSDVVAPYTLTWINPPLGGHTLTAVATDSPGLSSTSAPVHVIVAPADGMMLSLISTGATWRYESSSVDPGPGWQTPSYRDSGWPRGRAQLGYGDGDEATKILLRPGQIVRPVTTYFRSTFTGGADLSGLQLRVLRDDGIVVYLNGTEIFRNNMPNGVISNTTLASFAVNGAAENTWMMTNLSPHVFGPLLRTSGNVIAAEVHQSSFNNADMSFDLELTGVGNFLPSVALISPGANTALLAPASVQLVATASDAYGAVTNVQFLRNGSPLGNDSAPPYQFTWNNPPGGIHSLTAVATDNLGATKISAPVILTIVPAVSLTARSLATNLIELTWPLTAPGYHVETAPGLAEPVDWIPVNLSVEETNGQFRVLVNPAETERYFRLKAP